MMAIMRLKDVCEKYEQSYSKMYRHCREGNIPYEYVLGKGILVDEKDIKNFTYKGKYKRNDYDSFNKKYDIERDTSDVDVDDFKNIFDGNSLKENRQKLGISMLVMSNYLGVSLSGYFRMEKGTRGITNDFQAKLFRLFNKEGLL